MIDESIELTVEDEQVMDCYLWGLVTIWEVIKVISDNHNTEFDIDNIYELLEHYCEENDPVNIIKRSIENPKLRDCLIDIAKNDISFRDAGKKYNIPNATISDYFIRLGLRKRITYNDKKLQYLLKKYFKGEVSKFEICHSLQVKPDKLNEYIERYKKENEY